MAAGSNAIFVRPGVRALPPSRLWALAWIPALALTPSLSHAQREADLEAEPGKAAPASEETPPESTKKKLDLLIAPAPLADPANGAGFVVGALAFYNPNNAPQQWMSAVGVVYTTRGTKGAGGFHSGSFDQDRWRLNARLSYLDARTEYYGIGSEAGDRGESLELDSNQLTIQLEGLMRIFPQGYLGLRYRLFSERTEPDEVPTPTLPPPPGDQLHSTMSAIGPSFVYDTRDSATQPHRGVYVTAVWQFALEALGGSFNHDKLSVAANTYLPAGKDTVFAVRGAMCSTGGDVPYYDLCLFGSSSDLRGYPIGRYRDRASWAVQAEVRHHLTGRWGATAFVGLGGIGPSFGDLIDEGNLLPAAGVGIRFRPFKDNDVQLRADVAIGKNDHGIYVGVTEAF